MHWKSAYIPLLALGSLLMGALSPAYGDEGDEISRSLGLEADETVLVSRAPRPASKTAENVEVITADDIARINAHTLSDVLQTVPGIQLDTVLTPGSFAFFSVLGTMTRHIQVLIDGVPQNFLGADNIADPGSIPVQMIERVEIIKGAASAAWGSALGGVINVITKSPAPESAVSGLASGSYGSGQTSDLRGEVTGTVKRLGYYLTGGNIHSRGLLPGNGTEFDHAFGKITYDLPNSGTITLGIDLRDSYMGIGRSESFNLDQNGSIQNLDGYLTYRQPLAERLSMEVQAMGARRHITSHASLIDPPVPRKDAADNEIQSGLRAGLTWGDAERNLFLGAEYLHVNVDQRELVTLAPVFNFGLSLDRWSAYANGTYTIGRLSLLPGVRFDHASLFEDAVSYTLGATYRLGESTILRAYGARGYSMPVLSNAEIVNGNRELQNIWTVQAGAETSAIPYLWAKATLFYNNIWKVQDLDFSVQPARLILREQIRQGVEVQLKSSPVYGAALTAGYTYSQSWDKETKQELISGRTGPRQDLKLGVLYDNGAIGTRGALTGNYVYWYDRVNPARDAAFIWDLHLTQKLLPDRELSPELFFSVHNLSDAAQYQSEVYPNPRRWFEGGVRYRF